MDYFPETNLDNIEAISLTRKEIFVLLKSVLNQNINVITDIVEKEMSKKLNRPYILPKSPKVALSKLVSKFRKKWQQVSRNEAKFFGKFDEWLKVPVSFTIEEEGLKTPKENTMRLPSTEKNTADIETSDSTDLPQQEDFDYYSSVAPTPPPSHQNPTKRRRTAIESRDTDNVVTEAFALLNNVLAKKEEEEDECEMYCKLMVKRLRKLPEQERLQLMHDIDGMVLKAMFRLRNAEANSPSSYSMEPSTSMRSGGQGHRNFRNEEEDVDSKADIMLFEEGDR